MPELPEVETTVRGINTYITGKKITDCWTDYNSSFHAGNLNIKNPTYFTYFKKEVIGTSVTGASRRAKNVLIHLSNDQTILVHMKMTGHIMTGSYELDTQRIKNGEKDPWIPQDDGPLKDPFNRFIHFVLTFSDRTQLVLSDMRKFAKVSLVPTNELDSSSHTKGLGPEPLSPTFIFDVFKERILKRKTGKIKTVLMDQTLISGIGNIYSDEILWRAGVHPEEKVIHISEAELKLIFKALKVTLEKGIDFGEDSMSDYRNILGERGKFQEHHQAYRRTGKPCLKKGCGGTIIRKVVGGRSAHFCDTHQKIHG